jgi:hypothetical protein
VAGNPVEGTWAVAGIAWAVGCILAAGRRNSHFGQEAHKDQARPWAVRVSTAAAVGMGRRRRLGAGSLEGAPQVLCRPLLWWCDLVALVWWVMLWNRGASLWVPSCGEGSGMESGLRRTGYAGGVLRIYCRRCCS